MKRQPVIIDYTDNSEVLVLIDESAFGKKDRNITWGSTTGNNGFLELRSKRSIRVY